MLADALLNELSLENRKLVMFSDGRQDAAERYPQVAELNRYRDLIRQFVAVFPDVEAQITAAFKKAKGEYLSDAEYELAENTN